MHLGLANRFTPLLLAAAFTVTSAEIARAQGSLDPSVAPRAAQLGRQGDRQVATEMLGRYLATAPDDGQAWFQLGRFYLLDARDWHLAGHQGEPSAEFYLEFATLALDQAGRLYVDSGVVYRAITEMERALLDVEEVGWDSARAGRSHTALDLLPSYMLELGRNLLQSCPGDGVLLTGSGLETLAVWFASMEAGTRGDVLPIDPRLYTLDSLYRWQIARKLDVNPHQPVQKALEGVSDDRTICLTPMADTAAAPFNTFAPMRLVRVNADADAQPSDASLSITTLLAFEREGGSAWSSHVLEIYAAAARNNSLLCSGLLRPLRNQPIDPRGSIPLGACGR